MSVMKHNSARRRWMLGAVVCAVMSVLGHGQERMLFAMQRQAGTAAGGGAASVGLNAGQASGEDRDVVLDRVVAVVNGDVILESDVDEERRFEEIQPYRSANNFTRERAIERLINRLLILQQ